MHRRGSRSLTGSQRDDRLRSKVHGKVSPHKIRHRVTMNGYDLGHRHPGRRWAQLTTANLAEAHLPGSISRARLPRAWDKRMKRAFNGKECRALMVNHRSRSINVSSYSNSSNSSNNPNNEAADLHQPITARDM